MVITITYHDKPGEILYSFSKVGDNVCIGRDKRQCKIALGVNAQGVSRVHLKLELLSNDRLLARDTSTYGTGYDGGPLVVEKEKELKPPAILQIGIFFFVIKESVKQNCEEETIANPFLRIARINSRKRLASNKAEVVVGEKYVTEKMRVMDGIVEKLAPGTNDSEKEVARNSILHPKIQDEFDAHTSSNLSANEAWVQEQDRKLVAKLGKEEKEKMDSVKLAYYRRIADFLPSDDEDERESGQNKSKTSMFTMADSCQNVGSATGVSWQYDSSNKNTYDTVRYTHFPTTDTSFFSKRMRRSSTSEKADGLFKEVTSMKIMPENAMNDSILVGTKRNEILDDTDREKSKSLFNSTQFSSSRQKLKKSVNEMSAIEKNNTAVSHAGQFNHLESQNVSKKFRDPPRKTVLKKKDPKLLKIVGKQSTIATGLTSWLGLNTVKKRSSQLGNESNTDEMMISSKRVKIEVMENENKKEESEKNVNSIENRTDYEANTDKNDQILGMDIEVLRMKLNKAVQYKNLERPVQAKDGSQSDVTDHWQEYNYKRFRKAAQGSHGGCGLLHSSMTRIVGVADLIDFKEIA
ncbi:FHA domain family protein [Acanthocheilonema viteae]